MIIGRGYFRCLLSTTGGLVRRNDPAGGLTGWSAATAAERSSDVQSKAEAKIELPGNCCTNDWNKNDPTALRIDSLTRCFVLL